MRGSRQSRPEISMLDTPLKKPVQDTVSSYNMHVRTDFIDLKFTSVLSPYSPLSDFPSTSLSLSIVLSLQVTAMLQSLDQDPNTPVGPPRTTTRTHGAPLESTTMMRLLTRTRLVMITGRPHRSKYMYY